LRFGRGVNDERAHGDYTACGNKTVGRRDSCGQSEELFVGQDAKGVRSGQDTERAVVGARVVEMETESEDLFERGCGGVRVVHAVFDGPGAPTRSVAAFAERQGGVLVPDYQPIGPRGFVEKSGAKGKRGVAENVLS
jgi:hypothetical protein